MLQSWDISKKACTKSFGQDRISSRASEIPYYEVVFEIAIQLYDIHEPFFDVKGVKA